MAILKKISGSGFDIPEFFSTEPTDTELELFFWKI